MAAVIACLGCSARPQQASEAPPAVVGRQYEDVSLADLIQHPRQFDEAWVRVRGMARLEYEGTSLWPDGKEPENGYRALWLHVGWPLPQALRAMDTSTVTVEARFDADEQGHAGLFRGELTDIRAIWQPGRQADAYAPHYETRSDALEQLQFKTGWVSLGYLDDDGRLDPRDGSAPGLVPQAGDRIRLPRRLRLHIEGYATSGEARRMEVPTLSPLGTETRLWVAAGTLVHVDEIRLSDLPVRRVRARLSPVSRDR